MLRDADSDTLNLSFFFSFFNILTFSDQKKKGNRETSCTFSLHRNMSADLSHTSACESRVKSVFLKKKVGPLIVNVV